MSLPLRPNNRRGKRIHTAHPLLPTPTTTPQGHSYPVVARSVPGPLFPFPCTIHLPPSPLSCLSCCVSREWSQRYNRVRRSFHILSASSSFRHAIPPLVLVRQHITGPYFTALLFTPRTVLLIPTKFHIKTTKTLRSESVVQCSLISSLAM